MLLKSPLSDLERLNFLSPQQAAQLTSQFGSPVFVYDESTLIERGKQAMAFPAAFGLTVRYAMKANPLAAILRTFSDLGIHIDASSSYEAHRAIRAGIPAGHIMLTSQELPSDLSSLVEQGVLYNATSLHQLESYGQLFPGGSVSVRINSGLGSGHTRSVSVAGTTSSFGIWHEELPAVHELASRYQLKISTIHSHIGCGADPAIWEQAAKLTLNILEKFPDATTLNLGGVQCYYYYAGSDSPVDYTLNSCTGGYVAGDVVSLSSGSVVSLTVQDGYCTQTTVVQADLSGTT